jgi:hypothetical protein
MTETGDEIWGDQMAAVWRNFVNEEISGLLTWNFDCSLSAGWPTAHERATVRLGSFSGSAEGESY